MNVHKILFFVIIKQKIKDQHNFSKDTERKWLSPNPIIIFRFKTKNIKSLPTKNDNTQCLIDANHLVRQSINLNKNNNRKDLATKNH